MQPVHPPGAEEQAQEAVLVGALSPLLHTFITSFRLLLSVETLKVFDQLLLTHLPVIVTEILPSPYGRPIDSLKVVYKDVINVWGRGEPRGSRVGNP